MTTVGQHLIADLRCWRSLDAPKAVQDFVLSCIEAAGLRVIQWYMKEFSNGSEFGPGITVLALLAESHLALHTTPQDGMLYLELFGSGSV